MAKQRAREINIERERERIGEKNPVLAMREFRLKDKKNERERQEEEEWNNREAVHERFMGSLGI